MEQCIICGHSNFKNLFSATNPDLYDKFIIQRCKHCGLKRTLLNEGRDLSSYYQKTKYFAKESSLFNSIKKIFAKLLKRKLIEKIKNGGVLLDIGCGDGEVLKLFLDPKWKLYGIDPYGQPNSSNPNIRIYNNKFENTKFPNNYFDVLTFWHVFEHLKNPVKVLRECRRIIKNDGLLFISIPNSASFGFKLFKNKWFALYPPVHIYHYSLKTISDLLDKNRFKIAKVDRFSFEYTPFVLLQTLENLLSILPPNCLYKGLRGNAENKFSYLLSIIAIPFVLPILLALIFIEFLDPNGSSVVNIYATPKR